jgi:hypothetical protein
MQRILARDKMRITRIKIRDFREIRQSGRPSLLYEGGPPA